MIILSPALETNFKAAHYIGTAISISSVKVGIIKDCKKLGHVGLLELELCRECQKACQNLIYILIK